MKTVPCSGPGACKNKSVWVNGEHDVVGIKRQVEVPDDHEGPAYCSFECAAYDGVSIIRRPPEGEENRAKS